MYTYGGIGHLGGEARARGPAGPVSLLLLFNCYHYYLYDW